jgi:integrase/recombinase XerC
MQPHQDLLSAFLTHLRADASPKTYRDYASVLRAAQRDLSSGVIVACEDDLRAWIWGRDLAPSTRAQYTAAVRRLHHWLRQRGLSDYDPTELLPQTPIPRRLPRPVPLDQLQVVLTHTPQPVRLWCIIATYTGARCVELSRLDRDDITQRSTRLFGKGDKERTVPTHPAVWDAVRDLPPGPVAPLAVADPPKEISKRISRACRRVGPDWSPRVTAHRLRHTLATEVLRSTRDLRLVQDLLGHASPATTAIYTRVTPEWMEAAVAALPDWGATGSPDGADPA